MTKLSKWSSIVFWSIVINSKIWNQINTLDKSLVVEAKMMQPLSHFVMWTCNTRLIYVCIFILSNTILSLASVTLAHIAWKQTNLSLLSKVLKIIKCRKCEVDWWCWKKLQHIQWTRRNSPQKLIAVLSSIKAFILKYTSYRKQEQNYFRRRNMISVKYESQLKHEPYRRFFLLATCQTDERAWMNQSLGRFFPVSNSLSRCIFITAHIDRTQFRQ